MGWKTYPPQYVHWFYLVLNKISWIQRAAKPGWYKVAADNIKNYFSSNNITKLKIVCLPYIFMRNVIVHCEVILFGSLTGWTMYFHIHSLPIFELKCEKSWYVLKKIYLYYGKCLNNFYLLVAMHQKTYLFTVLTCFFLCIAICE